MFEGEALAALFDGQVIDGFDEADLRVGVASIFVAGAGDVGTAFEFKAADQFLGYKRVGGSLLAVLGRIEQDTRFVVLRFKNTFDRDSGGSVVL